MVDKATVICLAAVATLAWAGSIRAHHSISMFDLSSPRWVRGTVTRYEAKNPHVLISLEERSDGTIRQWIVEGPILARLARMSLAEDFLKVGDVIEVCGFPFRPDVLARPSSSQGQPSSLPGLHAHVLVMPDGHMQPWGAYGKLDNCIRPNDSAQSWVEFVNDNAMAREYWCNSRTPFASRAGSIAPSAFVDEITRQLATPCD